MDRRRGRVEQHQSVEHRRRGRRICPGRQGAGRHRHRGRQGRFPAMVPFDPAGAARRAAQDLDRDPGPQGRARPPAGARGGQDAARGHRRSRSGRADLRLLRRRGAAPVGREAGLRAAGRRGRDHARSARRHRADHALELPHRDSRVEDRAGAVLRQLRGVQARRPRAGLRPCAVRHHLPLGASPGRVQPRDGPRRDGRRDLPAPQGRLGHQLHRLGRHGPQGGGRLHRAFRQVPARDERQEPAGRARRRRPQDRGRSGGAGRLLLDRAALHGVLAPDRDRGHPRPLRQRR